MATNSRITIADVAEQAGVSRTTVSHVLSGKRPVAPATRERVQRVILDLGYRPNGLARSLRFQRSQTVALIVPDITNPYYPVLARGLDDAIGEEYRTLVCNTDADQARELQFVADAFDRKADGLVISAFQISAADMTEVFDGGVPVVSIGDRLDDQRIDVVLTDDAHGAYEATRYLIQRRYHRLGHIGGARGPGPNRLGGYRRALREANRPFDPELVVVADWTRPGGLLAMKELLALAEPPNAVFCANDLMAIGAIDAVREAGLSIPDDIAIVGFDDIESAALITPPLTTVANPAYEVGRTAGQLLLERITGRYRDRRRQVVLRSKLVERQST